MNVMPYSDPEKRRDYGREWMRRNPEKARAAMRRWRKQHPAQHAADVRAYYARDPGLWAQRLAAAPNRSAVRRAAQHRRRARQASASGSFTAAEWRALVEQHGGRCAYCGARAPLHADHRIPLARGGSNAIDNILPACGRCNCRKATMTESEFRARLVIEHLEDNR
jgi:5-methylcytosine-specific restriction endonuclease McrA